MIYFVEDDNSIRKLVLYSLTSAGLEAEGFARPSAFWAALDRRGPEVVLLDIMLPEEDGISILKKLREDRRTRSVQVILLTAKGSEYDKVVGLDAGADDYVSKPFGMMELMARVRSALRRAGDRTPAPSRGVLTMGPLTVDPAWTTWAVFTRDQLLSTIWGYDFDGASRTVDVHIRTLRQKLGEAGNLIQTVRGMGYKIEETP